MNYNPPQINSTVEPLLVDILSSASTTNDSFQTSPQGPCIIIFLSCFLRNITSLFLQFCRNDTLLHSFALLYVSCYVVTAYTYFALLMVRLHNTFVYLTFHHLKLSPAQCAANNLFSVSCQCFMFCTRIRFSCKYSPVTRHNLCQNFACFQNKGSSST